MHGCKPPAAVTPSAEMSIVLVEQ